MSARESLQRIRAHFAAHLDVAIADESPSQAKGAMELLDDVDVVLAALSTPPADDVREALAGLIEKAREAWSRLADNPEYGADAPTAIADAILAEYRVFPLGKVEDGESLTFQQYIDGV